MTFKHGNITVEIDADGVVCLRMPGDTLRIDRSEIDDVIMALCAAKQSQDPAGYLKLVDEKLYPYDAEMAPGYTATEMLRRLHAATGKPASASVDKNGATTLTIGEAIRHRETFVDGEVFHVPSAWLDLGVRISPHERRAREIVEQAVEKLVASGVNTMRIELFKDAATWIPLSVSVDDKTACSIAVDETGSVTTTWHPPYEGLGK